MEATSRGPDPSTVQHTEHGNRCCISAIHLYSDGTVSCEHGVKEIWSPRSLYDGIWRHGYDWIVRFFKTIFVKKPSCEVPGADLATLYGMKQCSKYLPARRCPCWKISKSFHSLLRLQYDLWYGTTLLTFAHS